MYNFNEKVYRENTNSVKYDELVDNFGRDDIMPFWVADMDIKAPDFMIDCLVKRAEHGVFGYTKRSVSYYESIMNWLKKRHGLDIKRENIEYSLGVVFSLNMLIKQLSKPNDKVIIQTPVYYPFYNVIKNNGRRLLTNPLIRKDDTFVIDFEDLDQKTKDPECTLMILCSPHNPVGRVWTKDELQKIGEICLKNNVFIISDEIHYDLVYPPNKHTMLMNLSKEIRDNCIICTSPSKTFNIAGLYSSFIICEDSKKIDEYRANLGALDINRSNVFSREVTEVAYNKGEKWVDELLVHLKGNIDFVSEYCVKNIKAIKPIKTEGTYLVFLDCRELGLSKEELDSLFVDKARLALDSGYWFGEESIGYMRLNVACPRAMLEEAMQRLDNAVKSLN